MKLLTGQTVPNGGPMINYPAYGSGQQFYPNNHAMHTLLAAQQFQQLQIQTQKQQQQLQQHQLHHHQLQQQQQLHQQQELQQHQQAGDVKMRGPLASTANQKDNASDGTKD